MQRPSLRHLLAASALAGAAVAAPVIGAPNTTDATTSAAEEVNPLHIDTAEAAWWHIAVREWGAICGFDKTWHAGWGWYSHEVERWAYTYTSSKPFCQESGERLVNRHRWPWVGQSGTLTR